MAFDDHLSPEYAKAAEAIFINLYPLCSRYCIGVHPINHIQRPHSHRRNILHLAKAPFSTGRSDSRFRSSSFFLNSSSAAVSSVFNISSIVKPPVDHGHSNSVELMMKHQLPIAVFSFPESIFGVNLWCAVVVGFHDNAPSCQVVLLSRRITDASNTLVIVQRLQAFTRQSLRWQLVAPVLSVVPLTAPVFSFFPF